MKKFLVLYMAPPAEFQRMMETTTPEQQKKGMQEWERWIQAHQSSLVDPGMPVGKTKRVSAEGVEDVRNEVGGYSVIQARTHDEAAKLFAENHPHFSIPDAYVEVMEVVEM